MYSLLTVLVRTSVCLVDPFIYLASALFIVRASMAVDAVLDKGRVKREGCKDPLPFIISLVDLFTVFPQILAVSYTHLTMPTICIE